MQCEICGKDASRLAVIELEGSRLLACSDCSPSGKMIEEDILEVKEKKAERMHFVARKNETIFTPKPRFDLGLNIVDNYGERVRKARESKNLTREELALKLYEKASIIEKIERNSFKPSDALLEKLENFLGISLREEISENDSNDFSGDASDEKMTLAYFIKKEK